MSAFSYEALYTLAQDSLARCSAPAPTIKQLAQALNLPLKAFSELSRSQQQLFCEQLHMPAFLLQEQQAIIFYNDRSPHWQQAVAHEIAHFLLRHSHDGPDQERDAHLLSLMLLAPAGYFPRPKAPSLLRANRLRPLALGLFALVFLLGAFLLPRAFEPSAGMSQSNEPKPLLTQIASDSTVYATPQGERFHLVSCYHLEGHDSSDLSVAQALESDLLPCLNCFEHT